jgi:hypothetical protein
MRTWAKIAVMLYSAKGWINGVAQCDAVGPRAVTPHNNAVAASARFARSGVHGAYIACRSISRLLTSKR